MSRTGIFGSNQRELPGSDLIILIYELAIPSDDMTSTRSPILHLISLSLHFQENEIEEEGREPCEHLRDQSNPNPMGLINPSPSFASNSRYSSSTFVSAYVVGCCGGTAILKRMELWFMILTKAVS